MNKRTYTLSEAAKQQRRLASRAAAKKRTTKPLRAIDPPTLDDYADIFRPISKDAPNSEHQSRAARIRVHMLKTGAIAGSARGGRKHVPRPCPRCSVECSTAREARDHCRVARNKS